MLLSRFHIWIVLLALSLGGWVFATTEVNSGLCPYPEEVAYPLVGLGNSDAKKYAETIWSPVFKSTLEPSRPDPRGWPGPEVSLELFRCKRYLKKFLFGILVPLGPTNKGWNKRQFTYLRKIEGFYYGLIVGPTELYTNEYYLRFYSFFETPVLTSFTRDFWRDREDIHFPTPFKEIVLAFAFTEKSEEVLPQETAKITENPALGVVVLYDRISDTKLNTISLSPEKTSIFLPFSL
jgi:hypothetical protein